MKIAVFVRRLDSPGGAEKSMKTLKAHLDQKHEVKLFSLIDEDSNGSMALYFPLPRQMKILGGFLEGLNRREKVEEFEPDLILAQHELAYLASWYSSKEDIPLIYFLRDYENLYENRFYGRYKIDTAVNYAFSYITERYTKKILEKSSEIIANSNHLGEKYEKHFNIGTETVYPFVNLEDYRVEETGKKILHVNPKKEKGIEITLEVAEKMPEKEFIIAGTTKRKEIDDRIEELENVEKLGYVEDMKEVYRQTKIVLVPSKWEEPYGRIPIEAGASGIPTIATKKGGLPESVGNQELLVDGGPEQFMEKIREVEENYDEHSREARKNAEGKRQEKQLVKFEEIMQDATE